MKQPFRKELARNPITPADGIVSMPEGPVLGIKLNEEFINRFEVR